MQKLWSRVQTKLIGATMNSLTNLGNVVCKLQFTNVKNKRKIRAAVYAPKMRELYLAELKKKAICWDCRVTILANGKRTNKIIVEHSWIGSFLLAIEFVRLQIPNSQKRNWVDEYGTESWAVLPERVPYSWGWEFFSEASNALKEIENKYVSKIEAKRKLRKT